MKMATYLSISLFLTFVSFNISIGKGSNNLKHELVDTPIDTLEMANQLLQSSRELFMDNSFDSAFHAAKKAKLFFTVIDHKIGIAKANLVIGNVFDNEGKTVKAFEILREAEKISTSLHNDTITSKAIANISGIYTNLGDYEQAVMYMLKADSLFAFMRDTVSRAKTRFNLGIIEERLENHAIAIEYIMDAIEIFQGIKGMDRNISFMYTTIGGTYNEYAQKYLREGDSENYYRYLKLSKVSLDTALNLANYLGDNYLRAKALNNLGYLFNNMRDYNSAKEYLKRGMRISNNYPSQMTTTLRISLNINLGESYAKSNEASKAYSHLIKALNLAEENNYLDLLKEAYMHLAETYYIFRNFSESSNYYKKYAELNDSILNEKKNRNIEVLRIMHNVNDLENEKLQGEIEKEKLKVEYIQEKALTDLQAVKLNQSRIGLIAIFVIAGLLAFLYFQLNKKNRVLDQAGRTEALLRTEAEHRIKNHLQMVSAFFRLHSQDLEEETAKKLVKQGESRIQAVGLLHQKLQMQKNNTSTINIKEYVEDLTENLMLSLDPKSNVILTSKIDTIELDTDQAVKIGLIINELINNSMKHLSSDIANPSLELSLTKRKGIQLKIQDNGRGFPSDFNTRKENSFGIQLVEMMSNQLHGEFSFYNDPGACFELNFN